MILVLGFIGVVSLPCLIISAALLAFRIYKTGRIKTVGNIILILYIVLAFLIYFFGDSGESPKKESASETHIETTAKATTQAETIESTTVEQPETLAPENTAVAPTVSETTTEAVMSAASNIPLEDIVGIYTCYAAGDNFYLELQKVDESTLSMHVWLYSENEGESSDIDTVTMKTADGNVWKGSGTEGEYSFYYGENDGFLHVSYPGLGDLDFLMADSEDEIPYPDGSTLAPVLEQETIPNDIPGTTATETPQSSGTEGMYVNLFDAPYPKDFSKDRNKIFKLMQSCEGKSLDDGIAIEADSGLFGPTTYKQTLDSYKVDYIYFGDIKDGKPNGNGVLFGDEDMGARYPFYAGGFKKGVPTGYGILFTYGHVSEEGKFTDGELSGKGIHYSGYIDAVGYSDFDYMNHFISEDDYIITFNYITPLPMVVYEGEFKKGEFKGKGKAYYAKASNDVKTLNISTSKGEMKLDAFVPLQDSNYGALSYEGEFASSLQDGKGTAYYSDGTKKYEGSWKRGKYDGKGTLYNKDGSVEYKGTFQNGDIK